VSHLCCTCHVSYINVIIVSGNDFNGDRIWPGISWRPFAVVCSIPAALALLLTYTILPESPRFLLGKKKFNEAVRMGLTYSRLPSFNNFVLSFHRPSF
jgi:hypothetical protein